MKIKTTLLALLATAGLVLSASAQIVIYEFTSGATEAPTTAVNVSASSIGYAGGATSGTGADFGTDFADEPYLRVNGAFDSLNASAGGIIEFTVTPASGFQIDLSSLSFDVSATGSGPDTIAVSVDGASFTDVQTSFQDTDATFTSIALSGIKTSAFDVQISGYAGGTGNMDIDTIALNGSVSAIPEPGTYAAFAGILAFGMILHRRRKQAASTEA